MRPCAGKSAASRPIFELSGRRSTGGARAPLAEFAIDRKLKNETALPGAGSSKLARPSHEDRPRQPDEPSAQRQKWPEGQRRCGMQPDPAEGQHAGKPEAEKRGGKD